MLLTHGFCQRAAETDKTEEEEQEEEEEEEEEAEECNSILNTHTVTSHPEGKIRDKRAEVIKYSPVSCCSSTSMSCFLCQRQDEHST